MRDLSLGRCYGTARFVGFSSAYFAETYFSKTDLASVKSEPPRLFAGFKVQYLKIREPFQSFWGLFWSVCFQQFAGFGGGSEGGTRAPSGLATGPYARFFFRAVRPTRAMVTRVRREIITFTNQIHAEWKVNDETA